MRKGADKKMILNFNSIKRTSEETILNLKEMKKSLATCLVDEIKYIRNCILKRLEEELEKIRETIDFILMLNLEGDKKSESD